MGSSKYEIVTTLYWALILTAVLMSLDKVSANLVSVPIEIILLFAAIATAVHLTQWLMTMDIKKPAKFAYEDETAEPQECIDEVEIVQDTPTKARSGFKPDRTLLLKGLNPDRGLLEIRKTFMTFVNQKLSGTIKPGDEPQPWSFGKVRAGFNMVVIPFNPNDQHSMLAKSDFKNQLLTVIKNRLTKIYGTKYPKYKPLVSLMKSDSGADPYLMFNRPKREFVDTESALNEFNDYCNQNKLPSTQLMLGYDDDENFVDWDLATMPHLGIFGGTGSGKGVIGLNVLSRLLWENSPDELQVLLVDPKQMELFHLESCAHVVAPVAIEIEDWFTAVDYAYNEMGKRAKLFNGVASELSDYNYRMVKKGLPLLPRLVLFFDEFSACQEDIEAAKDSSEASRLIKQLHSKMSALAKKARAFGIHLIVQSQDTLDGRFPKSLVQQLKGKVFCAMSVSAAQSAVTNTGRLNELLPTLNGLGDALFLHDQLNDFVRFQSPSIYKAAKDMPSIIKAINNKWAAFGKINVFDSMVVVDDSKQYDKEYLKSVHAIFETGKVTCKAVTELGYQKRAAEKILNQMEADEFISPSGGRGSTRTMLVTLEHIEVLIRINT